MGILNVVFPQWQGTVDHPELHPSAHSIRGSVGGQFAAVEVPREETLALEEGIWGRQAIVRQLRAATTLLSERMPDRLRVAGGDCGVSVAPIAYLNRRYDQELAVVWIDAHADLNTPQSSPSNHFAGMPLRTVMGEGDAELVSLLPTTLRASQVFMTGMRDIDPPEKEFMAASRLSVLAPTAVVDAIERARLRAVYIHLDMDVIDGNPHVVLPTPGGISMRTLTTLLDDIRTRLQVVGFTLTSYDARTRASIEALRPILGFWDRLG